MGMLNDCLPDCLPICLSVSLFVRSCACIHA